MKCDKYFSFIICLYVVIVHSQKTPKNFYVCPVDNDTASSFMTYRYNLLCQPNTTDCFLQRKFDEDLYSPFVIVLHRRRWNLMTNIVKHFEKCNVSHIMIEYSNNPTVNLTSTCSVARSTIIFDMTRFNVGMSQIDKSECFLQLSNTGDQLLNYISSTCPNTIWIAGSVNCFGNATSAAIKLLTLNSEKEILSDNDVGRTYIKGKHLRMGMIISPPYFFVDPTTNGYAGILFNLLEKISSNLQFTYSIHFPEDGTYGANATGVWGGLVGQLINNITDVALADLTVTYKRSDVIDFSAPYWFESIGIMIQQQDEQSKLWKMFSLFTFHVWLTILVSFFVSSFVLYVLHRFYPIPVGSPFNKFDECCWFSLSCFANQGSEYDPETWSAQNFMAFFWIYVFSLLSIYSGGLIAMLTSTRMSLPFTDLGGLGVALQQGRFKVTSSQGTASTSALLAGEGYYAPIRDYLVKHQEYLLPRDKTFEAVLANKDMAVLDEITTMEGIQRKFCKSHKLIILNERFFPGFFSFGLQKNSSLYEILSREITAAVDGGLIDGWKVNFTSGVNSFCQIFKPDEIITPDSNALTLSEFTGPFLLMGIGTVASLVVILFEKNRTFFRKSDYTTSSSKMKYSKRNPQHNNWIRY